MKDPAHLTDPPKTWNVQRQEKQWSEQILQDLLLRICTLGTGVCSTINKEIEIINHLKDRRHIDKNVNEREQIKG